MAQTVKVKGERRVPLISKGNLSNLAYAPICGFVGWNGSGKSLAAVAAAMVHLEQGRPVLSTVRLLDWKNSRPCDNPMCTWPSHGEPGHMAAHPLWRPFVDFRQLFTITDAHVLMDEVTGVADAREHASMPVQVSNFLPQLRRRNVTLHWTTIGWEFADRRIRRITYAVVHSEGRMGKRDPHSLWRQNRLFMWKAYTAKDFDAFESRKAENISALGRHVFWRPGSEVERAYSTLDEVTALGAATEAGMCLVCGGKRTMPRCGCDDRMRGKRGGGARAHGEAEHGHGDTLADPADAVDLADAPD